MGNSPVIFNGRRSKLLTADGLLTSAGRTLDFDGGINYIANGGAEVNTTGWATYADAAASSPVDGTGGSPSSTFTRSTTTPLRGQGSFLWTKSAANRQGEGFSYDFSIDTSDKAKVIQISFDYLVSSGTYADSDMTIWIYDVTNAALIQPAGYTIQNAAVSMRQLATFQSASNSTSYRLIVHTSSTSASAYTLQFDNFSVGPQIVTNGAAVSDWVSFTPTGSWTTNTTYTGLWRRIGDSMEIQAKALCSGAPTSAGLYFNMPSGFTIDSNKIPSGISTSGVASMQDSGVASYIGEVQINITANTFYVYTTASPSANVTQAVPFTFGANDYVSINVVVPITGWSSNVQLSSDTDTRVIAARAVGGSTSITNTSTTVIVYSTVSYDDVGAYNNSTGVYTVKVPGKYSIKANFLSSVALASTVGSEIGMRIYKNGTQIKNESIYVSHTQSIYWALAVSDDIDCVAGDTLDIRLYNGLGSTVTLNNANSYVGVTFKRLSGPSVIAASESVNAYYTGAPPTGTIAASFNTLTFGTKVKDSHNAYSGGTYTVPVSGCYDISASFEVSAVYTSSQSAIIAIFIDGVEKVRGRTYTFTAITTTPQAKVDIKSIPLLAGQLVTIRGYCDGTTPTIGSNAPSSYFSISKTGNY